MDTYFFFVPARLLWEHFENMFGENDTNYWAEKTEYSTPKCTIGGESGLANGSIGDYFGLPTQVKNALEVNALPAREMCIRDSEHTAKSTTNGFEMKTLKHRLCWDTKKQMTVELSLIHI